MGEREVEAALRRARAAILAFWEARRELERARDGLRRVGGVKAALALLEEIDAIHPRPG